MNRGREPVSKRKGRGNASQYAVAPVPLFAGNPERHGNPDTGCVSGQVVNHLC